MEGSGKKKYWNLGLKYSDAKLGERVKNLPNQQRVSSSKMLGLFYKFWRKRGPCLWNEDALTTWLDLLDKWTNLWLISSLFLGYCLFGISNLKSQSNLHSLFLRREAIEFFHIMPCYFIQINSPIDGEMQSINSII